jgi:hypothetical protein
MDSLLKKQESGWFLEGVLLFNKDVAYSHCVAKFIGTVSVKRLLMLQDPVGAETAVKVWLRSFFIFILDGGEWPS